MHVDHVHLKVRIPDEGLMALDALELPIHSAFVLLVKPQTELVLVSAKAGGTLKLGIRRAESMVRIHLEHEEVILLPQTCTNNRVSVMGFANRINDVRLLEKNLILMLKKNIYTLMIPIKNRLLIAIDRLVRK